MNEDQIQSLAKQISAALLPMLKKLKQQEPDDDDSNDANDGDGNGEISHGNAVDAVNERVSKFRRVLKNCTSFDDCIEKLADRGVASAGRRRLLIAKNRPDLWNARMSSAYNGKNA
jgi:hypothetical protein